MHVTCRWLEGLRFEAATAEHEITMDAKRPIGTSSAMSPKELLISALCGCTAMDIASLMKKNRKQLVSLDVHADASMSVGSYPVVINAINLRYKIGADVEPAFVLEIIRLSQSRYCSISAMLSKAAPIHYEVEFRF